MEKYWYGYTLRGCSPGCQPRDFVDTDESFGKFGAVAYNRELTEQELDNYELFVILEADAKMLGESK